MRRRRLQALAVVVIALASAITGAVVGSGLKSPAERAAERAAPSASRITVPVERRQLTSTLTLAGTVTFDAPVTVRIAGPVGASGGSSQVITRAPAVGDAVTEGSVIAAIAGRPVFVFQGAEPAFRQLEFGSVGADVDQLESALVRLGYDPGPVDGSYDHATEAAVDRLYADHGFHSEGASPEQQEALRAADEAVANAEQALTTTQVALLEAGKPPTAAERLEAQQALDTAIAAVPDAVAAAQRANDVAASALTTAIGVRDQAKAARDAAATLADAATEPGAVNPLTGSAYTADEVAALKAALADKETALLVAENAVTAAQAAQADALANGSKAVQAANDAVTLARAKVNELSSPRDTATAANAVVAAQKALDWAKFDRLAKQLASGTRFPAGEMIFVPQLPSTVTAVSVAVGDPVPTTGIATISGTATRVVTRAARADAALLAAGMAAEITLRDSKVTIVGTIASVGEPAADAGGAAASGGAAAPTGGGAVGGTQVVITPNDPAALANSVGAGARVTIVLSSTSGEVLVVPVAAVFLAPDGSSEVEVERAPVTVDNRGVTEIVKVEVGLTAGGFVEVSPIGTAVLAAGDRVVVGVAGTDVGGSRTAPEPGNPSTEATDTTAGQ